MLKIFTTQLMGTMQKIKESNEETYEDAGRLIAQSITSDGQVYVYGFKELTGIAGTIVAGLDCLPKMSLFDDQASSLDCVIVCTPESEAEDAIILVNRLRETGATVIGLSPRGSFAAATDFHIDLALAGPLVPTDRGEKIGYPISLACLFGYYGLYLATMDILIEHGFE